KRQESSHKSLVHNRYGFSLSRILLIELASLQDGSSHRFKITWRDVSGQGGRNICSALLDMTFDVNGIAVVVQTQRYPINDRGRLHTGHCLHSRGYVSIKLLSMSFVVAL